MIERAQRTDGGFALLLLDLDHFKEINDSVGHQAGDLLLRQTGRRLREQVRRSDVLARLGGDEFAVISGQAASPTDSIALAERLTDALSRPFHVGGVEAHIGTSIGIATFPEDARDGDQLLARADMALYAAKGAGRGTWRLFDPRMQKVATERRLLESELRIALRDGQLELAYQPVIRAGRSRGLRPGGAAALEPSGARRAQAGGVRAVRRAQPADPADHRMGARPGARPGRSARRGPLRERCRPRSTSRPGASTRMIWSSVVERLNARALVPDTPLILEITEGALTEHERAIDVLTRAPAARRPDRDRRLRRRLFLARAAQGPAARPAQDRSLVHRQSAARQCRSGGRRCDRAPRDQPRHGDRRRGRRDDRSAAQRDRSGLRPGPGLPVREADADRERAGLARGLAAARAADAC